MTRLLTDTVTAVGCLGAYVSFSWARRSRRAWKATDLSLAMVEARRTGGAMAPCAACTCCVARVCRDRLWEYFPPRPLYAYCPCRAAAAASGIGGLLRLVRIRRQVRRDRRRRRDPGDGT